jgi:hypothetical protein
MGRVVTNPGRRFGSLGSDLQRRMDRIECLYWTFRWTQTQIASELKTSRSRIATQMRAEGIPTRPRGVRPTVSRILMARSLACMHCGTRFRARLRIRHNRPGLTTFASKYLFCSRECARAANAARWRRIRKTRRAFKDSDERETARSKALTASRMSREGCRNVT